MRYILILLVLLTFLISDEEYEHEKEHYYRKDLSYLYLNKSQKSKVKQVLKEYQKELRKYIELKKDIARKKRKLFMQKDFDKDKVKMLTKKLFEFSGKIEANFLNNMHKILNQKQRKKFSRYMHEWEIE